ncbi:MAG TPA: glycosyltransferase family 2 protein [Verrucomicrobiae bacterium]|nr:glycosyltransferase family 2 protein [Verrucomicrobiae bacterium]
MGADLKSGARPKISVVTPSFNQAPFLEETIRSVLLQNYPNLEFLIFDGGSTDGSVEVLRKYAPWLAYWTSAKDRGQTDALNQGFRRATGEWIAWQNSDDFYAPGAFHAAALAVTTAKDAGIFYGPITLCDMQGGQRSEAAIHPFEVNQLARILFPLGNQSMFFHQGIFQAGHFLDESFHWCMDHEFFWRLWLAGIKFQFVPTMRGFYRQHDSAKSHAFARRSSGELAAICERLLANPRLPAPARQLAIRELQDSCYQAFHHEEAAEYRAACARLRKAAGQDAITPGLAGRLAVAALGRPGIKFFRSIFGKGGS